MAIIYPKQKLARFELGLGFNYSYLNHRWGFDLGERFHRDPDYRVATTMEIDRAVFQDFGKIGLGFKEPFPRPSVEPFGHRFIPAVYGCECRYAPDAEPWAVYRIYAPEDIRNLEAWTPERFKRSEPLREITAQADYLHARYGKFCSLPDLGSVINNALYLLGDDLFVYYIERPDLVQRLYDHITQLTLLAVEYFSTLDGAPLAHKHIGNCTVAMLSPADYLRCNFEFDRRLAEYCRGQGIPLEIHQDSNVTPHLENYAHFTHASRFDFGQDTDFEKLARLRPDAAVNCIWFPHYLLTHRLDEIREEARRLTDIGRAFRSFSFTLYEIDPLMTDDLIFGFYDALIALNGE